MSQATPQTGELNEPEFDYYMSLLSIEERALVSFKVLEDLEFSEIAKILGLSLSAVKMRYYRALEKIQSRLT
jgi:RNA polymerase sigma-70 factor (ECF subfamily)